MTKQDLITRIAIQRNLNGMTVEEAKISVYGYTKKTLAQLKGVLASERKKSSVIVTPPVAAQVAEIVIPSAPVDPRDAEIADLKRRIDRLEAFITGKQDRWETDDDMLNGDTLRASVVAVVEAEFYVSSNVTLSRNYPNRG